jgi:hypothetical protein
MPRSDDHEYERGAGSAGPRHRAALVLASIMTSSSSICIPMTEDGDVTRRKGKGWNMGAKQVPVSGKDGDSPDAKMAEQVGLSSPGRASMVHLGGTVSCKFQVGVYGCAGWRDRARVLEARSSG